MDHNQGEIRLPLALRYPASNRSTVSPNHDNAEDSQFVLKVLLNCRSTESLEEITISISPNPRTVLDIKKAVEADWSIPVCTQQVSFGSSRLTDVDCISTTHIRSGDSLFVTYKARAECEPIKEAIDWMCSLNDLLKEDSLQNPSDETFELVVSGYRTVIMENLAFKRFSPWVSPVVQVNKLYFLQEGGLEVLFKLLSLVLKISWSASPPELKYVEHACMTVISNLASSLDLRKMIVHRGVVPMCLQSLLRVRLKKSQPVVDDSGSLGIQNINDAILKDAVRSVVAIIANICELPETHVQVSSNVEALHQLVCVSHSPSYEILLSQLVASIFLCLSHSPEVHGYLADPEIISSLLEACDVRVKEGADPLDSLLLEYFTQTFMAHLVLSSPHLLPQDILETLATRMEKLLRSTTPLQLMKYEEERRFSWSVFLPYVKLAYIPTNDCSSSGSDQLLHAKLKVLALETVLLWLTNTLGRASHRDILVQEGLSDYVICLPWHLPKELEESANALVSVFMDQHSFSPPSLSTLAKAKLAKMHFGLPRMMRVISAYELLL